MMNWIYTWYKARLDGNAEELAQEMGDIFLQRFKRTPGKEEMKSRKFCEALDMQMNSWILPVRNSISLSS